MARITEKEVHTAAAELDAQGVKPTTSKIREKLGSGSFSTIQTYLASYEGAPSLDEVPQAPAELAAILPAIWSKAWDIASGMFEAERIKAQEAQNNLQAELATLEKIIEDQDGIIERQTALIRKIETENKELIKKSEALKEKNSYMQGQLDIMGVNQPKRPIKPTTAKKAIKKPAVQIEAFPLEPDQPAKEGN